VSSPFGPLVVIANPHAGGGTVGRNLPALERALADLGLDHRVVRTAGAGDAARAATEALARGERFLVVAGGDGTIHEVVNGMMDPNGPMGRQAVLGVMAAGSGADFVTTFGLPGDVEAAARHLEGRNLFDIDLGKVTYTDPDGRPATRYFANVAQAGLGADAVARAARMPGSHRARRFLGFWAAVARFRPGRVVARTGDRELDVVAHDVVVANGQYHGGGLRISPRSWPGDGLLDVLVMTGPRSDAFTLLPRIYRGEHLPHPHITELKVRSIEVMPDRPWPVQADGEVLGSTPATFEIVRHAIRLKI
jgi:YegS/Rv2252/BmrU family lipid kinase